MFPRLLQIPYTVYQTPGLTQRPNLSCWSGLLNYIKALFILKIVKQNSSKGSFTCTQVSLGCDFSLSNLLQFQRVLSSIWLQDYQNLYESLKKWQSSCLYISCKQIRHCFRRTYKFGNCGDIIMKLRPKSADMRAGFFHAIWRANRRHDTNRSWNGDKSWSEWCAGTTYTYNH